MKKTVEEIIEKWINHYKEQNMVFNDDFIRFQKILEIIEVAYENELAEKDRKIDLLLTANKQITYSSKSRKYNQPKLYKEDLEREQLVSYEGQLFYKGSIKKEIYHKLPSKEEK